MKTEVEGLRWWRKVSGVALAERDPLRELSLSTGREEFGGNESLNRASLAVEVQKTY